MSVLRGTSDLTDKGLRTVASIRCCLRMEEHDEYSHVLGANPGKVELTAAPGSGFLRTPEFQRPVLGRTVNVDLASIDRHAVACSSLRPTLDGDGLRAIAALRRTDIANGKCDEGLEDHWAFIDVEDGAAYTNRWDRYGAKLASMRGEEAPEPRSIPARKRQRDRRQRYLKRPRGVVGSSRHSHPTARVYDFPGEKMPASSPHAEAPKSGRDQILTLLREAGEAGVSWSEFEQRLSVGKTRIGVLLQELRESGEVMRGGAGHVLCEYEQAHGL
jgi:hypothetical protein